MADLAVSPTIALRRRSDGAPLVLDPALEIGAGGEARVLGLPGDPSLVAKLYRQPTIDHARKLARMMEAPPALAGAALAWPLDLLTDLNGGRFAGFLMPRAEGPRIFELYNPVSRRRSAPLFDWGLLHRAGASLAAAFDALHGHGYVVGDVNESNILVSPADASVTLVDADSFQVRDAVGAAVYRSAVGKAEFTPPELQGSRFGDVDRAPEHDRFGLAVLLFLLLMEGTHPFAQRFENDAESLPVEERIRRGLYPHARAFDDCRPPRLAPPIQTLHPGLQALFLRCFARGHGDPAARPSAAEWRGALAAAEAELRACDANPRHRYSAHVPFCPWCHRRRLLRGRDPFPASVELARATDLAPPAPRRLAAVAARPAVQAAPPAVQPTPVFPAARPSALAMFLAGVQAALPDWIAGPAALGGPLPWAGPALLTILFGASGGMRLVAMAVGFMVLRRLFRGGLARVTALTGVWIVGLMLLWSLVNGIVAVPYASGPRSFADGDAPYAVVAPPVARGGAQGAVVFPVFALADVDVQPELSNRGEVNRALSASYPTLMRDAGVTGTATVRFTVTELGEVDDASLQVVSATHDAFAPPALAVVRSMRFWPARKDGRPVAVRVTLPVTFVPQG